MLQGGEVAATSNSAYGCTPDSSHHEVTFVSRRSCVLSFSPNQVSIFPTASGGKKYRLWDTSGLNEGNRGTVPTQKAMFNLVALVKGLRENAGGVSLLVYCIRGARLREIIRVNYDLFWGIICNGQVPIVLVITGLENEDDMEDWWRDNRIELEDVMGMKFQGHVCMTSTKGKIEKSGRYMFEEEYQESVGKVRNLVESGCALHPEPLRVDGERWIADVEWRLKHYLLEYNQRTGQERRTLEDRDNSRQSGPGSLESRTTQGPGFFECLMHLLQTFRLLITLGPQVEERASHYHDVTSAPRPGNYTSAAYGLPKAHSSEGHYRDSVPEHSISANPLTYRRVQGNTQASVPKRSIPPPHGQVQGRSVPEHSNSATYGQVQGSTQSSVPGPSARNKSQKWKSTTSAGVSTGGQYTD